MRTDQAYLNDLAKFDAQFHYHIRDNNNVSTALAKLHAVLDQILAVNHSETQ